MFNKGFGISGLGIGQLFDQLNRRLEGFGRIFKIFKAEFKLTQAAKHLCLTLPVFIFIIEFGSFNVAAARFVVVALFPRIIALLGDLRRNINIFYGFGNSHLKTPLQSALIYSIYSFNIRKRQEVI